MIGHVHDRSTFVELRRRGRRARAGSLTVWWLDDPVDVPPRVAFAIGRHVGPAVVRNRIRRRLRHCLYDLVREEPSAVPAGAYLINVAPSVTACRYGGLAASLATALADLARSGPRS